jgi:glutamyl-tRNA synthetase
MLSVVVDDHDMNITHADRGADHLTNSFRQVQLYQAMGWRDTEFGHIPLIHGNDGQKLSKRHGAMGLDAYRAMGILPVAMRNDPLRLGWGMAMMRLSAMPRPSNGSTLAGLARRPPRYDLDKLLHLNSHYMKQLSPDELMQALQPFPAEWKQERFGQPLPAG